MYHLDTQTKTLISVLLILVVLGGGGGGGCVCLGGSAWGWDLHRATNYAMPYYSVIHVSHTHTHTDQTLTSVLLILMSVLLLFSQPEVNSNEYFQLTILVKYILPPTTPWPSHTQTKTPNLSTADTGSTGGWVCPGVGPTSCHHLHHKVHPTTN